MIIPALLAAVLAVPSSAQVSSCVQNEMTSDWEKISFALWLTDYTIPESSPRTATLKFIACTPYDGLEIRSYVSADSPYVVTATTDAGGASGATTLKIYRNERGALLGTWAHHKVFYKGVGIDKVAVPDAGDKPMIKNVFVIPTGAVVKP